jgi:hypothetical protein
MTDTIVANTGISNTPQLITGTFTPTTSGTYYVGINGYMNGSPWYISIDDISITETPNCPGPISLTTSDIASDSANLSWTENGTATSWQIEWDTANFSQGTGNLLVTTSNPYSLDSLAADTEYDFYVRAICGVGDTSAWATKGSFTTACNAFSIPYTEGFESGYTHNTDVAGCLSQESVTGTQTWTANNTLTTYSRTPRTGSWNAFLPWSNDDWLFIPISLTGGTSYTATVYANQDGTTTTNSNVGIRYGVTATAAAMTDTIVANIGISNTPQLITGTFTPTTSGTYYVGINGYMNSSPYYISIDDISITETPNCPSPISLTTSGITSDSANLSWTENGTATSWQIEWDTANFSQGTGNLLVTTSNPYSLDSLAADTEYDFYVRAICGVGDTSAWATKGSFTTACNAFSIPYTEGFESGYTHNTDVAGCLSQESVTGTQTWTANNTLTTYSRTPRTGSWNAFLPWSNDDWLFIPISLTGGTSYTATVYANQDGTTTTNSNVGIRYGVTATAAAMTDTIVANTGISNTPQLITGTFTPTTSGTYYVGINGYMNFSPWYISIDDISIKECSPTSSTALISACDNYTWTDGVNYTASNSTALDTFTNAAGCDSVVTLNLTILNSTSSTDVISACDNYTWTDGVSYTASNSTALDTFTNAAGCDSVVTLSLTMLNSSSGTDVISACDNYTWTDGITYTASNNTALDTFTNAAGCDSVVTLSLTILNSTSSTNVISACDNYTWTDGVNYTASNSTALDTFTNAAGCDSVVTLSLTILNSTSSTDVISACDNYTWTDGITYTASNNTALDTFTNAAGCDSVVTLSLTILNSTSSTDVISACDNYTWTDGVSYTASNNTALDTFTNAAGCDSVVTLSLTILNSTSSTDVISACNNYTWTDGITYTASNNTALDTFTNAAGCDSVVTLSLTILNSTSSADVISACDNYTWTDGITYTASNNTALDTFTNAAGCDSVVTLSLTILNSTSSTDVISACDNYTWTDGVSYTASNNTALDTFTNAAGCDSVVTLSLTILNSTSSTDVISACNNYTWTDGITYTASNNTALDTFTNAAGCDSVVTLSLTILNSTSSADVISACDNYTWTDGITYTASNNTALDTFTNAAGCDSVVTLSLTILNSTSSTDVISACNNYTWTDGITYTASNSTALDTFTNAAGCDSVVTLDLTIIKNDLTITNNDPLLEATVQTGATYQWLNCLTTYSEIAGATNASFNGSTNGEYAIEITNSSCVDTSECQIIQLASVFESLIFEGVSIYPNPNTGLVNVDLNSLNDVAVNVYDISGNLIYAESNISGGVYQFNLEVAKGMYIIEISAANQTMRSKLIKR